MGVCKTTKRDNIEWFDFNLIEVNMMDIEHIFVCSILCDTFFKSCQIMLHGNNLLSKIAQMQ